MLGSGIYFLVSFLLANVNMPILICFSYCNVINSDRVLI